MPTFRTLAETIKYIKNNVREVMSLEEIQDIVKDTMREVILDEVYQKYISTAENPYERRYDEGGFSDVENYVCKINVENNYVSLTIFNDTNGNDMYSGSSNEYYIDSVIYDGDKYTWKNSDIYQLQPYPRDWIKETIERLYSNGELIKKIGSKLEQKGISVEY